MVDLIDAIYLNKYLAGFVTLTDVQMKNANVYLDENVNDDDTTSLMEFILSVIADLPVQPE